MSRLPRLNTVARCLRLGCDEEDGCKDGSVEVSTYTCTGREERKVRPWPIVRAEKIVLIRLVVQLQFDQLTGVSFEIGEVDLAERVEILSTYFVGDLSVVVQQEFEEESISQQGILWHFVVGHGLAELIDFLQNEFSNFTNGLQQSSTAATGRWQWLVLLSFAASPGPPARPDRRWRRETIAP